MFFSKIKIIKDKKSISCEAQKSHGLANGQSESYLFFTQKNRGRKERQEWKLLGMNGRKSRNFRKNIFMPLFAGPRDKHAK